MKSKGGGVKVGKGGGNIPKGAVFGVRPVRHPGMGRKAVGNMGKGDSMKDKGIVDESFATRKPVPGRGIAYVKQGGGNVIRTLAEWTSRGPRTVGTVSGGQTPGFQGKLRGSSKALRGRGYELANKAGRRMREVHVVLKGDVTAGVVSLVMGLDSGGIRVVGLTDMTHEPFGGCRKRKVPRI